MCFDMESVLFVQNLEKPYIIGGPFTISDTDVYEQALMSETEQ